MKMKNNIFQLKFVPYLKKTLLNKEKNSLYTHLVLNLDLKF